MLSFCRSLIRYGLMCLVLSVVFGGSAAHANWRYEYGFGEDAVKLDHRKWDFDSGGWWFNFGPTGIRVKFEKDKPRVAQVTYVFPDSPADGKIMVGDHIIGVNGKRFTKDAIFAPGRGEKWSLAVSRGLRGEVADAIEESEGNPKLNGMISFLVTRKTGTTEIKMKLEPIGYFSKTFPYNCRKSELLAKKAADWLMENSADPIGWKGRGGMYHVEHGPTLALMSFGKNSKYWSRIEESMRGGYDSDWGPMWSWITGMYGVALAEYCLMADDKKMLPRIERLLEHSVSQQGPAGQYSHKGYNPEGFKLAFPTGLNGLFFALAKKCGAKFDEEAYMRTRNLLTWSTNEKGGIGYGAHSDKPITLSDVRAKTSSINIRGSVYSDESHDNGVGRLVGGAMAATLMHLVDPSDSFSEAYVKRGVRHALCARWSSRHAHSCGSLTLQYCFPVLSLGPVVGDDYYREAMDDLKAWFNIARCHDGSYYFDPKIDTESDPASRLIVTGGAILLLNSPKRNLYILGKGYNDAGAAPASQGSPIAGAPAPEPEVKEPVRKARSLSPDNRRVLDQALEGTLVKLSEGKLIKPMPMRLSFTSARVALVSASADELVFMADNGRKASISWDKLAVGDRATLAVLTCTLKPDSGDAQALAGVYMESLGRVEEADKYFERAGESSRKKLETLFN